MGGTGYGENVGKARISKSLIKFSAGGWGCIHPMLQFGLRPNYGRDNGNLLHSASMLRHPGLLLSVTLTTRHPQTPEHSQQVWLSLLWGHCSFLLDPDVHEVLFVPSKTLFPQSCESFVKTNKQTKNTDIQSQVP